MKAQRRAIIIMTYYELLKEESVITKKQVNCLEREKGLENLFIMKCQ